MKEHYYIDLEQYSLHKFKSSIQNRDMIPSRVILKENIEERFEILTSHGIRNLKVLIDTLKTKQKIDLFSTKANLSIDYLTILKREASSYHPNPIKLDRFPGIDPNDTEILEDLGIRNTKQIFEKVIIQGEMKQLSQLSGISIKKLNEFTSLADLARLYGVGPVFARIIYDIGINSVKTFMEYKAEELIAIYEDKTGKKADFGVKDINFSIELANELY